MWITYRLKEQQELRFTGDHSSWWSEKCKLQCTMPGEIHYTISLSSHSIPFPFLFFSVFLSFFFLLFYFVTSKQNVNTGYALSVLVAAILYPVMQSIAKTCMRPCTFYICTHTSPNPSQTNSRVNAILQPELAYEPCKGWQNGLTEVEAQVAKKSSHSKFNEYHWLMRFYNNR